MFSLSLGMSIMLVICVLAVCTFEFINGFQDTANAVATVIYTKSLKPNVAVIWAGCWNFIGVYVGGIAVAMGIVKLLPTEALIDQNVYHAFAMIFALILTAILWNLTTWFFGIPSSSSHAMIGSIFGVGVGYLLLPDVSGAMLNWSKLKDVGLSLFISPAIGFGLALGAMALMKIIFKKKKVLFEDHTKRKHPPVGVRSFLIFTSTLLSFSHGSNDGQKGIGLMMIILIAIVPAKFAIDSNKSPEQLLNSVTVIEKTLQNADSLKLSDEDKCCRELLLSKTSHIISILDRKTSFDSLKNNEQFLLKKDITVIVKESANLYPVIIQKTEASFSKEDTKLIRENVNNIKGYVEYAPVWVILLISTALGLGTMIGWKRIVVTVGEKIGKTPLTYAQGASANLVASCTIGLSTLFGLPVSTTHVLNSGVAGTMVSKNGLKNLRMKTVKNIMIAWVVTLPVTIILSCSLFLLFRWIVG
jgi:low-affinity inorganic phosphate transporter